MRTSKKVTRMFIYLLLLCLFGSIFFLNQIDNIRTGSTLQEVLYISSPKTIRRMSLGYEGFIADIYWTRAVQYFGGHHAAGAQEYKLLAPLLNITTTLDPHLTVAYEFGSAFLTMKPPNGAGMPEEAVKLVDAGIKNNPNDWHLYYDLGFIYYLELKDYAKAEDAFKRGSQLPNAHPWLKILAARMAGYAGDIETSRMMWSAAYETSQEKAVKANAAAHLRALDVDETVTILESLIATYQKHYKHTPSSFSDLIAVGILKAIPLDPSGRPYKLMPDGQVEVRSPDDLPFIQKGLPPGYVAPAKPKYPSIN